MAKDAAAQNASEAVLVVEDKPVLRFLIVEELEAAGYEVFEAADASKAISILETFSHIRLLFTDIDLLEGDEGLKLAKLVRERWPPIRIILTSGNPRFLREEPVGFAERFLPKPCDRGAIPAAIRECLAMGP